MIVYYQYFYQVSTIVFFRQLIYNYPEQLFADAGVMAIEHADFEGVERLALVLGKWIVILGKTSWETCITGSQEVAVREYHLSAPSCFAFSSFPFLSSYFSSFLFFSFPSFSLHGCFRIIFLFSYIEVIYHPIGLKKMAGQSMVMTAKLVLARIQNI